MRSWPYLVVAIVGLPSRRLSVGVKLQALGLLSLVSPSHWGQSLRGKHPRRLHILTVYSVTVSNAILIDHGVGSCPSVLFDRL